MAIEYWEDSGFDTRSIFHPDHRKSQDEKILQIKHLSTSADDTYYNMQFEISTKNLKNTNATIFLIEVEVVFHENVIPPTAIQLNSTGVQRFNIKFSKNKQFSKSIIEGELEFKATVVCDGLSAETKEFPLKLEKNVENKKVNDVANKESNQKEKSKCYCNRDFTFNELEEIIKKLRESNKGVYEKYEYKLFSNTNCEIPLNQKTYESFLIEINQMFFEYGITTCIRKIHFLAQSALESEIFTTAQEKGSLSYLKSKSYYPFIGRGVIQITHSGEQRGTKGYKQYFKYLNRDDYKTNYNLLNKDLHLAIDVGGYFWKRGKLLSRDYYIPKYPNEGDEDKRYNTHKLENHFTIDLSLIADDDNVKEITYLINGALSHIEQRIDFTNLLKEIFNYEKCTNKK